MTLVDLIDAARQVIVAHGFDCCPEMQRLEACLVALTGRGAFDEWKFDEWRKLEPVYPERELEAGLGRAMAAMMDGTIGDFLVRRSSRQ